MIPREVHLPEVEEPIAAALRARDLELFGVVSTADPTWKRAAADAQNEYSEWIDAGLHGGMGYLERHADRKYAPERILPGCRSVIVVGLNYFQKQDDSASGSDGTAVGAIARYAWGRDYHNALGKRLRSAVREWREHYPDDDFRFFVDSSPLSERFFAEHADIGYTARNTLTISSAFGSWFFLGEILTTAAITPTPPVPRAHGGCPSGCFRCGDICPTGALYDHHRIDASRCISYLTIEHRGPIPIELRPRMGTWIFGCDLCQAVCPLNVRARESTLPDFTSHRAGPSITLESLLRIPDEESYRRRFEGSPLRRPGRSGMVRNACIAAANAGAQELTPLLRRLSRDDDSVVREAASWALGELDARATARTKRT